MNDLGFLKLEAHTPISLWDMIRYFTHDLVNLLNSVSAESDHAYIQSFEDEKGPIADASNDDKHRVLNLLKEIEKHCEQIELVKIKGRLEPFKESLEKGEECTYPKIDAELKALRQVVAKEIRERIFTFIPPNRIEYFEQSELFGKAVNTAFPSVIQDLKDAGNCLAADLNTAAVFHLMRVSEYGLRALAERLGAIPAKWPIEFSQWKDVIVDIESKLKSKVEAVDQMTKGYDKDQDLDFYNGLMADIRHLKMSRDKIMHARECYERVDALAVYARVEDIMRRLAEKVSEK